MSDFKLFCEVNKEIDTGISKLYADAKCLLKFSNFIIRNRGWDLNNPIKCWEGVKVKDGRITQLYLDENNIGVKGVKGLVLPHGLKKLDLYNNDIGTEGAKGLVLPPRLQRLNLYNNNIGAEGAKGLVLPLWTSRTRPLTQQYRRQGCCRTGFTTWTSKTIPQQEQNRY